MSTEVFRISALLIVTAAAAVMLKSYRPEFSMLIVVAACAAVLGTLFAIIKPSIEGMSAIFQKGEISIGYFNVALKALGIAYISGFAADTCRDFGQTALAAKAEFAGKCAVFALCVPLMRMVLETALEFAGL